MKSQNNKVYLETIGCQMNVSDSERVRTNLVERGYEIVGSEHDADVVLINTCSIREKAENKLYTRVGEIRSSAAAIIRRQQLIGVMGCVAQLEGETLLDKSKKIDFVVGTKATGRVADLIESALDNQSKAFDLGEREADYDWTVAAAQRQSRFVAFVPIIEGCNKFCTYCIVPFSRGREQSRSARQIVEQVLRLRDEGVREVHLIGQNVNSYRPVSNDGLESFAGSTPFVRLLRAVAATKIERVKFTTSFPRDFRADIVAAIEEHPNLCNWVHLPVQSGSDHVLKMMRRGHTIASYLKHVEAIKKSFRQIALTSDFIVGFPGETEADAAATVKLISDCDFDSLYIFKYSPRPNTPAASQPDDVPEAVKQQRFIQAEQAQRQNQNRIFENYVGRTLEVLAEKISTRSVNDVTGHSTCHKLVNFALPAAVAPESVIGQVRRVKITAAKTNSLYGIMVV